ncbi:MAG: ABC transporter ATP-binding protein [Sarcina sp.]
MKQTKSILPLLSVGILLLTLISILNVYLANITKNIIDSTISANLSKVYSLIFVFILVYVLNLIVNPISNYLKAYIGGKTKNILQFNLYKKFLNADFNAIKSYSSMDIVNRLNSDVDVITNLLANTIPTLISLLATFISAFISLCLISKSIALFFVILFPLMAIVYNFFAKKQKKFYHELQVLNVDYKTFTQESIQNISLVKSFCIENSMIDSLSEKQNSILKTTLKQSILNSIARNILTLGTSLGFVTSFLIGIFNLFNKSMSFGEFTALLQLYHLVQAPFMTLSSYLPNIVTSFAATERLMKIEKILLEENSKPINNITSLSLDIQNVSFSYIANKPILSNFSATLKSGDIIGLVGKSGIGKTTLINLILSYIKPSHGSIKINNELLSKSHRSLVSYVPQEESIFSRSIKYNICFTEDDSKINKTNLEKALLESLLNEVTDELPSGLDTIIGESHSKLSGGQLQRIALARALYFRKPILILDEATASLDSITELTILKNLLLLDYAPLIILVTHKTFPLDICNKIIRIN